MQTLASRRTSRSLTLYAPKPNALKLLQQFCFDNGLAVSGQFSASGQRLSSWTSPTGNCSLLDYIAVPSSWEGAFQTLDTPCLGDLHSDIDHQPILVRCRPSLQGCRKPLRPCPDWRALDSPEGKASLHRAWASARAVGWDVDATTHIACIHAHLHRCLARDLPRTAATPRNPAISSSTLAIIKYRRHIRRCERSAHRQFLREALWLCMRSWQASVHRKPPPSGHGVQKSGRVCRRWFGLLQVAHRSVARAISRDRAAFFRDMMRHHHDAGPAQFAFFIRSITRQGRKFKPPQVLRPVLSSGTETADRCAVRDALGRHFAAAELATEVDIPTLLEGFNHRVAPESTLLANELPCLAALASGFAQLQGNKAPGISGLVPEVFRLDPVLAAINTFPVVVKAFGRGHVPAQWAGGVAATVPKPGKSSSSPEGWRAILLLEADGKALKKSHAIQIASRGLEWKDRRPVRRSPRTFLDLAQLPSQSAPVVVTSRTALWWCRFCRCTDSILFSIARSALCYGLAEA